jgi:hypothetical protein
VILDPAEVRPDQADAAGSAGWSFDPAQDGGKCAGLAIPTQSSRAQGVGDFETAYFDPRWSLLGDR